MQPQYCWSSAETQTHAIKTERKVEQNKVIVNSSHNKYRIEKIKAHFLEVRHNEGSQEERHPLNVRLVDLLSLVRINT
jgi:hypothetical protein